MRRRAGIAITVAVLTSLNSPAALAAGGNRGPDHGSEIVHNAAHEGQTGVTIFAEQGQVHYIITHEWTCMYPLAWAQHVITHGTASEYYEIIGDLIGDPANPDLSRFGADVPETGGNSCIQHVYHYFGSCTDEDRIAVRAIDALWDARTNAIGSYGEIGLHEYPDRYCVEVVDIDTWRQIINAEDYLPEPVRATYPQFRTLVGLENDVWYDVQAGDDRYVDGFYVELPTPGTTYNVTVDLWLEEVAIDVDGDGEWDHVETCSTGDAESLIDCGGSLEDPIFSFVYEERSYHHFIVESRWAGEAVDDAGIVHVLDPNHLSVQHVFDWETVEVRSSLDG